MENIGITLNDILEEYNKYLISKLIDKNYNFDELRNKIKEFSKTSDLFNYNGNQTEQQIINNITNIQQTLSSQDIK